MQALLKAIYPPRCLLCEERVEQDFAFCGACWGQVPFITGLTCRDCGVPLPGTSDRAELCDACLASPRAWRGGVALMLYEGAGRDVVLRLKHGDRADLARAGGEMLAQRLGPVSAQTLIAPVPLHWRRLARRRFNQSARLAQAMARVLGCTARPDLLTRPRATPPLGGHDRAARAALLEGAVDLHPRRHVRGRDVVIVDDVMTTGATLQACAHATLAGGAASVRVAVLARAVKLV